MTASIVTSPGGNYWSPAYALLGGDKDYIEWTLTLDALDIARFQDNAVNAGVRWSGPFYADVGAGGYITKSIWVNGVVGGIGPSGPEQPFYPGPYALDSDFNRFNDMGEFGTAVNAHQFFVEGENTIRVVNNYYSTGSSGKIHVDFVWIDDCSPDISGFQFTLSPYGAFRNAAAPAWFAGHTNPGALNNSNATDPFILLKASDGTPGTQANVSLTANAINFPTVGGSTVDGKCIVEADVVAAISTDPFNVHIGYITKYRYTAGELF